MSKYIDKKTGTINMAELSRYNGKTPFENLQMITEILMMKAVAYKIPQTMRLSFKGKEKG